MNVTIDINGIEPHHYATNSPLTPVELPSYVLKEATTLSLKADIHLSINSTDPLYFLIVNLFLIYLTGIPEPVEPIEFLLVDFT
jgi:hypothetical protein